MKNFIAGALVWEAGWPGIPLRSGSIIGGQAILSIN
jgi:hypothetical protein